MMKNISKYIMEKFQITKDSKISKNAVLSIDEFDKLAKKYGLRLYFNDIGASITFNNACEPYLPINVYTATFDIRSLEGRLHGYILYFMADGGNVPDIPVKIPSLDNFDMEKDSFLYTENNLEQISKIIQSNGSLSKYLDK